jgi:hypothetical protein
MKVCRMAPVHCASLLKGLAIAGLDAGIGGFKARKRISCNDGLILSQFIFISSKKKKHRLQK